MRICRYTHEKGTPPPWGLVGDRLWSTGKQGICPVRSAGKVETSTQVTGNVNQALSSFSSERSYESISAALKQKRYARWVQWSKVKTRVKALIAPSLRRRIDFHMTQYRVHHNHQGTVCTCRDAYDLWVTIDKQEVFRASYCRYASESWVFELKTGLSPRNQGLEGELVRDFFNRREIHDPWSVKQSLISYLGLNPHRALRSRDPIHKAFAIIDRRVGYRSLTALRIAPAEHPLVRLFYWLRSLEFS